MLGEGADEDRNWNRKVRTEKDRQGTQADECCNTNRKMNDNQKTARDKISRDRVMETKGQTEKMPKSQRKQTETEKTEILEHMEIQKQMRQSNVVLYM